VRGVYPGGGVVSRRSKAESFIPFEVTLLTASERAVKVRLPDEEEVWFPFSQIDEESIPDMFGGDELRSGAEVKISVTEWIAKQKGLA